MIDEPCAGLPNGEFLEISPRAACPARSSHGPWSSSRCWLKPLYKTFLKINRKITAEFLPNQNRVMICGEGGRCYQRG